MASANPFDLLGDTDYDDPLLLAATQVKAAPKKLAPPPQTGTQPRQSQAKLPTKPPPPSEAVRNTRNEINTRGGRGFGRGAGRARGRGADFSRGFVTNENVTNGNMGGLSEVEDGDIAKPSGRGSYGERLRGSFRGRRGAGEIGNDERPPRRVFERHSGTGRGNELKREGAGRGNWGIPTDELSPETEIANAYEKPENLEVQNDVSAAGEKENTTNEAEEAEDKEMTLEEYEKVLEEKRRALQALKVEERKVTVDKELESMHQLSKKRDDEDVFVKLGYDKDRRKDSAEKEEKAKKALSINEFLKPSEGPPYYGGGRGRGRGARGGFRGGYTGGVALNIAAPSIEDPGQFPSLGAK